MKFSEFGLDGRLLEGLEYMGIVDATPVQEAAIPIILEGSDLIACAQTGTGKTAAFMLPVLSQLARGAHDHKVRALVICPTRELAMQIDRQIQGFSYFVNLESNAIYGGGDGMDFETQKKALTLGCDVVVATPGKLLSHLNLGYVDFKKIEFLILDEADRMLDMGFMDDIQKIINFLPKERQTLLFSATMPPKIGKLAEKILNKPKEVRIAVSKTASGVLQAAYMCYDAQKVELLNRLIKDKPSYESILIFCSTRKKVTEISRRMLKDGFNVASISSDLEQNEREEVLNQFKARKIRIIVATDVLSRGIDVKDINLVINYDVPMDAEDYVHRVGRTARASTTGVALTLINPEDARKFSRIEELIEMVIPKVPIPPELGEAPEYNPKARVAKSNDRSGGKRKPFRGKR